MTYDLHGPASRRSLVGAGLGALGGAAALGVLAAAPAEAGASSASFYAYPPTRIADTRSGAGFVAGSGTGKMRSGQTRTVSVASYFLPGYALTAVVNVMVLQTAGSGSVRVWKSGATRPAVPTVLWWAKGQSVVNLAICGFSSDVTFDVRCAGTRGAGAHVLVELLGYFFRPNTARARTPAERPPL